MVLQACARLFLRCLFGVLVFSSASFANPSWEIVSKAGYFPDFEVDNNTIYLAENLCKPPDCEFSRILHLDIAGRILDSCRFDMYIWSISVSKNFIIVDGAKGYQVFDKNWRKIDSISVGMRAFFLSDTFVFYGEDCSDEGLLATSEIPKNTFIDPPPKKWTG